MAKLIKTKDTTKQPRNKNDNLNKDPERAREVGKLGGRPKGSKNFKVVLTKVLEGIITIHDGTKQLKMSKREAIAFELAIIALDREAPDASRLKAMDMIIDRLEGKPHQSIDQDVKVSEFSMFKEVIKSKEGKLSEA